MIYFLKMARKKKPRSLRCPTCHALVMQDSEDFPFCSDRCRLIDLGKWASGGYVISTKINDPEMLESLANEPSNTWMPPLTVSAAYRRVPAPLMARPVYTAPGVVASMVALAPPAQPEIEDLRHPWAGLSNRECFEAVSHDDSFAPERYLASVGLRSRFNFVDYCNDDRGQWPQRPQ